MITFCLKNRSILLLLCAFLTLYHMLFTDRQNPITTYLSTSHVDHGCPIPKLDENSHDVQQFFHKVEPLVCPQENDFIWVESQRVYIRDKTTKCKYSLLKRKSDSDTVEMKSGNLVNGSRIKEDFFKVNCSRKTDRVKKNFENLHATVKRLDSAVKRSKQIPLPASGLEGMNVYVLAFDSLSQLSFRRNLPKFYSYLKKMDAVVLNRYNIVGDGTAQALIPILTGYKKNELPSTEIGSPHAKYVDVYPFIWDTFQNASYVTLYGEDSTGIATFTYMMKGFDKQPTDHYMRTFYMAAEKEYHKHDQFCWGSEPHHVVHFRYVEHFFDAYVDLPKFAFQLHGQYSHDDNSVVQIADDYMLSRYLNNTLLMVMSDHGSRFQELRKYHQGQLEERLPMMSLLMPKWFKVKYPTAMLNLRENADALTSPFDIHTTLSSVLKFTYIKSAHHYTSSNAFMRFQRSQDPAREVPEFGSRSRNEIQNYQIQFISSPGYHPS